MSDDPKVAMPLSDEEIWGEPVKPEEEIPHTPGHINCPGCAKAQIDAYGLPNSRIQ